MVDKRYVAKRHTVKRVLTGNGRWYGPEQGLDGGASDVLGGVGLLAGLASGHLEFGVAVR